MHLIVAALAAGTLAFNLASPAAMLPGEVEGITEPGIESVAPDDADAGIGTAGDAGDIGVAEPEGQDDESADIAEELTNLDETEPGTVDVDAPAEIASSDLDESSQLPGPALGTAGPAEAPAVRVANCTSTDVATVSLESMNLLNGASTATMTDQGLAVDLVPSSPLFNGFIPTPGMTLADAFACHPLLEWSGQNPPTMKLLMSSGSPLFGTQWTSNGLAQGTTWKNSMAGNNPLGTSSWWTLDQIIEAYGTAAVAGVGFGIGSSTGPGNLTTVVQSVTYAGIEYRFEAAIDEPVEIDEDALAFDDEAILVGHNTLLRGTATSFDESSNVKLGATLQDDQENEVGTLELASVEDGQFTFDFDTHLLPVGNYTATVSVIPADGAPGFRATSASASFAISPVFDELLFTPTDAVNECPAVTADTLLSGVTSAEMSTAIAGTADDADNSVVVELFRADDDTLVGGVNRPFLTQGDDSYYFEAPWDGLQAGEYYAVVTPMLEGQTVGDPITVDGLSVSIEDCPDEAPLFDTIGFQPADAANVCPASTATSALSGETGADLTAALANASGTIQVEIYQGDGDEPLAAADQIDLLIDDDGGYFDVSIEGLWAGDYYAIVTTFVDGTQFGDPVVVEGLSVEISECADTGKPVEPVDPNPTNPQPTDPKPAAKQPGTLANTGATALPVALLTLAALGSGAWLRRRNTMR